MDLKDYIRSTPDYPKKGILFRDITTLIKHEKAFASCIDQIVEKSKNFKVDKIAPSDLIAEVGPVKIPVGFTKINLPFEKIDPLIIDVPLKTLLRMLDFTPGWLKWTAALEPTLNVSQLTIPWLDVWFTFIFPTSGVEMVIFPLTTLPPVGRVVDAISAKE